MNEKRVALVTGANKGIGFEVCRQLGVAGYRILLGARNQAAGKAAAKTLKKEGLEVEFIKLDVTSDEDVAAAQSKIEKQYGRIDILVNNAGVLLDPPRHPPDTEGASIFNAKLDTIRRSLETNTFGAIRLSQALVPLMKKNSYGRIVNISSGMGQLSDMNGGWPGYRISKAALNVVTRILADELTGTNILVNSVCPGWVRTSMGGEEAELSPAEGADTIVWLASHPDGGPSGGFFRERQQIEW